MNTRNNTHTSRLIGATLTLVLAGTTLGGDIAYVITDLGTVAGPDATTAPGSGAAVIDATGRVAGFSIASDEERNVHGFRWDDGVLYDLPPRTDDIHSQVMAMNDNGVAVGISYVLGELRPKAVRWVDTVPETLAGFTARGINDAGVVVGERALNPGFSEHEAVTWENDVFTYLGTLGGRGSGAYDIDEDGRVVGMSMRANNRRYRAFVWIDGVMTELGTLGGANSHAFAINDNLMIAGFAYTSDDLPHAVRYTIDADGQVLEIADLAPGSNTFSYALDINNLGVAVGSMNSRATMFDDDGPHDLNMMVDPAEEWNLMKATAVNDAGQIVGLGMHRGLPRAFLLTPVVAGDLDGSGTVDIDDLLTLLANWDTDGPGADLAAPFDVVDVNDLLILLGNWGL